MRFDHNRSTGLNWDGKTVIWHIYAFKFKKSFKNLVIVKDGIDSDSEILWQILCDRNSSDTELMWQNCEIDIFENKTFCRLEMQNYLRSKTQQSHRWLLN